MSIFIGFLTVVLFLDCALLVLLVLLQLPKKEAGAGLAFGGGATDVLFGAGAGNVLTKTTSYAAGIFLGLCLILTILQNNYSRNSNESLKQILNQRDTSAVKTPAPTPPPVATPDLLQVAPATATNALTVATNTVATPVTGGTNATKK